MRGVHSCRFTKHVSACYQGLLPPDRVWDASPLNTKKALVSAALQFEPPKGSALALLTSMAQAAHRDQSYYHEKK